MRRILVVVDHDGQAPQPITLQALTAARQLDAQVAAVWCGPGAADAAPTLAAYGAGEIFHLDADVAGSTWSQAAIVEAAFHEFSADTVMFGVGPTTDVIARVAVRLGAGVITEVVGFTVENGQILAQKDVLGGTAVTTTQVAQGRPGCIGVAANAFAADVDAQTVAGAVVMLRELELDLAEVADPVSVAAGEPAAESLAQAAVVVTAGGGVGSADGYAQLQTLAQLLGGSVAATRVAVEEGWADHHDVIGQTGHTVTPALYLAVGVSGAPEHVSGMRTAKTVVAINKDPHAPIFDVADFGIVGDAQHVVPQLIAQLQ